MAQSLLSVTHPLSPSSRQPGTRVAVTLHFPAIPAARLVGWLSPAGVSRRDVCPKNRLLPSLSLSPLQEAKRVWLERLQNLVEGGGPFNRWAHWGPERAVNSPESQGWTTEQGSEPRLLRWRLYPLDHWASLATWTKLPAGLHEGIQINKWCDHGPWGLDHCQDWSSLPRLAWRACCPGWIPHTLHTASGLCSSGAPSVTSRFPSTSNPHSNWNPTSAASTYPSRQAGQSASPPQSMILE